MFLKKDSLLLGIILGIIAPFIGLYIFYLLKARSSAFPAFLQSVLYYKSLFTSAISLSLIANAIVFTIYVNTDKDKTARGVFISTCVYGIFGLLINYVF